MKEKKIISYFQDFIIDACKSFSSLYFESSQFQNYNITSKLLVCQGKELLNSSNFVPQSRNKVLVIYLKNLLLKLSKMSTSPK